MKQIVALADYFTSVETLSFEDVLLWLKDGSLCFGVY